MITAPSVDSIISRLRPRDVGGIIDQSFRLYRKYFLTFLAITAIVYVPIQLVIQALTLFLVGPLLEVSRDPYTSGYTDSSQYLNELFAVFGVYIGGVVMLSLLAAVVQYLSQGALTAGVADTYLDKQVSLAGAYREMLTRIGPLLGFMGLQVLIFSGIALAVLAPFILLALASGIDSSGSVSMLACLSGCLFFPAMIFGLYINIRLKAAIPAIMIEGLGPMQALHRSWYLVDAYWWRTFGLTLLLSVISFIVAGGPAALVSGLVQVVMPSDPIVSQAISGTVGVLTSAFYVPLELIAITLYYFDLRVRKEGFDITTAMNQAYPPYGYSPPAGYGLGQYGQGQPDHSPYGQDQASPMYPPALGQQAQQSSAYSYAPAPTQPSGQYGGTGASITGYNPTPTPQGDWPSQQGPAAHGNANPAPSPTLEGMQNQPAPASGYVSTPYGNDPLGLYTEPRAEVIAPQAPDVATPDSNQGAEKKESES